MAARIYLKDGKRVPGASTVAKIGSDPGGLLHWANKGGLEGKSLAELREAAPAAGNLAHAMVEARVKGLEPLHELDGQDAELAAKARAAFDAWVDWTETTGFTPMISEISLVSKVLPYGGTIDCVGHDRKGRTVLGDLKTGARIYPEHITQIAAYRALWDEHHDQKIEIVQLWQFTPDGLVVPRQLPLERLEGALKCFRHQLEVYWALKDVAKLAA